MQVRHTEEPDCNTVQQSHGPFAIAKLLVALYVLVSCTFCKISFLRHVYYFNSYVLYVVFPAGVNIKCSKPI